MTEKQFIKKMQNLTSEFLCGMKYPVAKRLEIIRNQGIFYAAFATEEFCHQLKENDNRVAAKNRTIQILKTSLFK